MLIETKQCIFYAETYDRCLNDGVRSIHITRGGHDAGNGWYQMKQEMIYWLCNDHYAEKVAELERLGWTVEC